MANNLSKKFALLTCSIMAMQALRLVISTAGFCVVRFHIDCALFNIFISRLVNAVMMSQLFGNWLGDLIVFTFCGRAKLWAAAFANWVEFGCFCSALICIVHTECGHLTGFYWSMVTAYFWWKVGEASATSIAANEVDYYFSGFTLSGVWAACLKGLVMRCVSGGAKTLHFNSDTLGDVNVKVVGARSVKLTIDYRAAKWLYVITIILTFLVCVAWTWIPIVVEQTDGSDQTTTLEWDVQDNDPNTNNDRTKGKVGAVENGRVHELKWMVGIAFGGVLAVPGAMLGVGIVQLWEWCTKKPHSKCTLIFWGIVGAAGGFAAGVAPMAADGPSGSAKMGWIWKDKWKWPWAEANTGLYDCDWDTTDGTVKIKKGLGQLVPLIGLGVGLVTGFVAGEAAAMFNLDDKGYGPTGAGALVGSFFGLIIGEMVNGANTWKPYGDEKVVGCGLIIVSLGLGTVYSIYPGMAPCSITQFKYFNIIDILILFFSSIAPLVIMYADLGGSRTENWRLGKTIPKAFKSEAGSVAGLAWLVIGLLLLIATNICEIIVLDIMQHPFSKSAHRVTTNGWLAVFLTVTMVTSQLVSSGIGFGCVAAGSTFNDGWVNVNSTAVLWTIECTGVLGEGYLTELKKYEPGKWPTQEFGKWRSYWWWNGKAFGNAWAIWCCIGTTDLRRDIMLCRQ